MNVAIVNNQEPFVRGGAELLAEWLQSHLIRRGHKCELIRIPFLWDPPQKVAEHVLAVRLMRIPYAERVIALKFPAYLIPHDDKVLWLLHQFRQAYDLRGTDFDSLSGSRDGASVAELVARADTQLLRRVPTIYTNSRVTSDRLWRFNGLHSEVLYPPLFDEGGYRSDSFGDYIFYPSRIGAGKRQSLLLESLAFVRSDVRVVIAGAPDRPEDLARLEAVVARLGLGERVELLGSWISEERKRDLFANALACAYLPYDEDSYGYVSLESFCSRKPVITCTDSGGTLELVEDGVTGRVVEPDPRALAEAIDQLRGDVRLARKLGEAGHERLRTMNISWDHVIDRLLA